MAKTLGHNENKNLVDLDQWVQDKTGGSSEEIEELKEAIKNIWSVIYPVGSIYISVSATNPGTIWGGTWVAWGTGRVPVGVNTGETEFNQVEKVGGSKNSVQTHTHNFTAAFNVKPTGNGTDIYPSVASAGSGNVTITDPKWVSSGSYMWNQYVTTGSRKNTGTGVKISGPTTSTGVESGNLQPYITCYMWKRIE